MRWPLPWPRSWRTNESQPQGPPGQAIEEGESEEEEAPSFKESAVLFARDLGVALLVVVIVMLILLAYTQVWPPMVVVESRSMQHSNTESFIGVIDTGDLVLVQDVVVPTDIVPWVEGRATGHRTYSDFGDVIIFLRPTQAPGSTPIIHRAYAFVIQNGTRGVDVPSLAGLPPGTWDACCDANGTSRGPYAYGIWEFTLRDAGWQGDRTLVFNATAALARAGVTSGFLTKGDNNPDVDPYGAIHVDRVLGKARGELPWFGLIKLTLSPGESGCCRGWGDATAPKNSWDSLVVSLILIIVGPFVVDYGWAWFQGRRKAKRRAARAMEPPAAAPPDALESGGEGPPLEAAGMPPNPEPDVTDEARTGSSGLEDGDP